MFNNQIPILSGVGFYNSVNTIPDTQITTPIALSEKESIYLFLQFSGLDYIGETTELYINISLIYNTPEETMLKKNVSLPVVLNEIQEDGLLINLLHIQDVKVIDPLNLIDNYFSCEVFCSDKKVTTTDTFLKYSENANYRLFTSKVPLIGEGYGE